MLKSNVGMFTIFLAFNFFFSLINKIIIKSILNHNCTHIDSVALMCMETCRKKKIIVDCGCNVYIEHKF